MSPEERALIDGLFERLRPMADAPRDAEAEALIARRTGEQPHAPYALAQTVLVQEHALKQAQARIEELEAQAETARAEAGREAPQNSFLGGLLGGRTTSVPRTGTPPIGGRGAFADAAPPPMPQAQAPMPMAQGRGGLSGGGFLASAMTTAAGVAGGALLFHGISSMLGGSEAKAAESAAEPAAAASPWGDAAKDDAAKDASDTDTADAASGDTGIDPFGDDTASAQDADFDDDNIGGGDWV
ncbi:MAG TPA: DUF2076 domain-containing protein [Xanthobacteraceae bacterium]|nr:DUF2076 domain-containing protein [Xanthobacteraceae bacterium]